MACHPRPPSATICSTGVRGAETPTGNFTIQYKMLKTRMRGTNPDGHSYDIPDVPWVMALFGDYTLHGAPWRQAWGVPLSNGCVSMPTPNAVGELHKPVWAVRSSDRARRVELPKFRDLPIPPVPDEEVARSG